AATATLERPAPPTLGMHWTEAARRKILPWRGMQHPPRPAKPDLKKVGARLKEVSDLVGRVQESNALLKSVAARWSDPGGTPHEDPAVEGALGALLGMNDYTWSRGEEIGTDLVSVWIAGRGLAFAVRALCLGYPHAACGEKSVGLVARDPKMEGLAYLGPWTLLRFHLAAADETTYREARDAAAEFEGSASETMLTLLAFAFPDEPEWVRRALQAALASTSAFRSNYGRLLASVSSLDQARPMVHEIVSFATTHQAAPFIQNPSYSNHGIPPEVLPTMADRLGPAAAVELLRIAPTLDKADHKRMLGLALGAIHSPEVAEFFSKHLDDKYYGPYAHEFFQAAPELAAGKRGAAVAAPQPPAGPEAAAAELPGVLADPPWLKKAVKTEKPIVVRDLAMRTDFPETVEWAAGEREKLHTEQLYDAKTEASQRTFFEQHKGLFPERLMSFRDKAWAVQAWNTWSHEKWNEYSLRSEWDNCPERFLKHFGIDCLPGLLLNLSVAPDLTWKALARVNSPRVAPSWADAYARLKKVRAAARRWLLRFPEAAAVGLIPQAAGPTGKARDAAQQALRLLAANGHAETVRKAARSYG
ncbi:MAG: hypothetical protein AB1758_36195, partial [Candidatus Eremiobacterota bacterium]